MRGEGKNFGTKLLAWILIGAMLLSFVFAIIVVLVQHYITHHEHMAFRGRAGNKIMHYLFIHLLKFSFGQVNDAALIIALMR